MSRRRSLHIGLNRVDPAQYGGWDGALSGCVNDANAMRDVAVGRGFTPALLIDEHATIAAVRDRLDAAAAELDADDFFFLTYSGHGGQVADLTGDERDSFDETWCLYDTELVDDSLFGALCTFKRGVRVFVMSDSCHSETVTRGRRPRSRAAERPGHKAKLAPLEATAAEFAKNRDVYAAQSTWWEPQPLVPKDADANVVLISGCQDQQTSMDGPVNGAFTTAFLQVWTSDYRKSYQELRNDIVAAVDNADQTPGIFFYGVDVAGMLPQIPFSDDRAPAAGRPGFRSIFN
ncbi:MULTISPECIES: caspase family protein [unclassified Mycobacterium]|uniref:caspase family protein n=1 Tax=unclassified Mycobacterium TaxID=2642494 RepID=UPI0029C8CC7D|nr:MULTISPECIES: caspase family protein [unclassified Mycobacterium]